MTTAITTITGDAMDKKIVLCPCCGEHLSINLTEDGIAVKEAKPDLLQQNIQKIASELGIEVGAHHEGGE